MWDMLYIMEIDSEKYISLISSKIKQEVLLRFRLTTVPLSAVDIKRKLVDIDISQVSFILRELHGNDLIRCVNPKNKRNRFFEITQDGEKMMNLINERIFQVAIEKHFKNMGYQLEKQPNILGLTPDMVFSKNDESIVVEVNKGPISEKSVHQVLRYKKELSADKAFIVTVSNADKKIMELASSKDVELWDGKVLDKLQGRILYPKKAG